MQAELFAPHQGRILVVDDTSANIQAVTAILREHGYQISVATNGRQALSVLERVRPDLILLDVLMPEMDGFEACRRIKHNPAYQDIPIIFLTAKTDATDIVRGFELGAVDYVPKPFNAYELLARVNTHLTLDRLNRQNEQLLLNVLPASIAEQLKKAEGIIAERLDDVSVLFADIVGFTALSARIGPTELIDMLNRLFSAFDELVDRHGLEKIKTIGDAYMVAGGLPEPRPGHLEAMATFALDMSKAMQALPAAQRRASSSDRDPRWQRRRGRHRSAQVQLRRLGRHGEHCQPPRIARRAGAHSGERGRVPAAARSLRLRALPHGRVEREGSGQRLFPRGAPGGGDLRLRLERLGYVVVRRDD